MNGRNCPLLAFALTALAMPATQTCAQSTYTPYAFANFAGQPGVPGANNGTGTAAQFNSPQGLALDSVGNVYVADQTNNTIRRITPAGVVTTLAGFSGEFVYPTGLAVDNVGNIYVGNTYNHTIDRVSPVGPNWVVTTLAGSPGVFGNVDDTNGAALFRYPTGVAVDSATNIYVADYINARIRKITPVGTNWVVTTLAGFNGEFKYPDGVALDNAGNVYVADEGKHTIQKVTPAGTVTTLAGSPLVCGNLDAIGGAALFCRPHGVAVDSATNIYVADYANNAIRKISPVGTNWVVTTLAGAGGCGNANGLGSGALFCGPNGLAVDITGRVYVADGLNHRITTGKQVLIISRPISNIVHHFTPPDPLFGPGVVSDEIIFDRAGLTNIDLSQFGAFELRLFAPADRRVVVNAHSNLTSSVNLYYLAASDGASHPATNNSLTFENFSGVLPTRTYSFFAIADAGNAVFFQADHSYTNRAVFTAMTYTFTPSYNPANTTKTFQLPTGATNLLSFSYTTGETNDPGSFIMVATNTLTIGRQITNILHHFTPGNGVTDEVLFDRAGLTNIDLSQYVNFELRLFVPPDQRVIVNPPTNFTSALDVFYLAPGETMASHFAPTGTLSFENFSGVLPARTYSLFFIGDAGSWVEFQADEDYNSGIGFTAMKYGFTPTYNPTNAPKTFQEDSSTVYPFIYQYNTSLTTDPGPFVALTTISPLISVAQGSPGNVTISWSSKLSVHYQVQCATNLMTTIDWTNLGNEIIGDGLTDFVSDSTTNRPAKYYRIKILP